MKKIPKFLEKYFWEIKFPDLDIQKSRVYFLRRILECGDEKAIAWLWRNFKKSEIKDFLIKYRGLSQKSANYWAVVLNIPRKKVRCLNRSLAKKQKKIWHY